MTPETRRNLLRYGIPIDLVILAIGAAMLAPPSPGVLLTLFAIAVLLSTWKSGWHGGLTALVLSVIALAAMFETGAGSLTLFTIATAAAGMAVVVAVRARVGWDSPMRPADVPQMPVVAPPPATSKEEVAATANDEAIVPAPVVTGKSRKAERAEARRLAREEAERASKAQREQERAAAERERLRLEAERDEAQRLAREAEERAAREREETERVLQAKLQAEREEAERHRARLEAERAEAERLARAAADRAAREREEAERVLAAKLDAERAEAERLAREAADRAAREREEAERVLTAKLEAERAEAVRLAHEAADRAAREREEAERVLTARFEAERAEAERERTRLEAERAEAERLEHEADDRAAREREDAERLLSGKLEAERAEAERARVQLDHAERARVEAEEKAARGREELERLTREREAARQELQAKLEAERAEAERIRNEAEAHVAAEREQLQREMQTRLEAEREAMRAQLEQQLATERAALAAGVKQSPAPKSSLLDAVTSWFKRDPRPASVNLNTKRVKTNGTMAKRAPQPPPRRGTAPAPKVREPRLVFLERRRGTADTILPKLRQRGIEFSVVERWVDAADELLRLKPDALFLDVEHPDFKVVYKTTLEKSPNLPIILTGRGPSATPPNIRFASFVARPYDTEEVTRIARQAMTRPDELLGLQALQRTPTPRPSAAPQVVAPPPEKRPEPLPVARVATNEEYATQCYTCRIEFNAVEADWCSCLAKERSLLCTNCLSCFCKAPPAYKERFWVQAPPRLFERKTADARKQAGTLPANPPASGVTRPLVLAVEDDEDIQAIVQRICTNLGYGIIHATNGQDGLELAREYRPNLILSDAFMPKLDGREMCRMLKEDPAFADTTMVVMTGLYTDTKYRSEALKRFHIDDYIAKPVAVTDLINLLQRHLEGVAGLPAQDDLHERHRKDLIEVEEEEGVPLADLLDVPGEVAPAEVVAAAPAGYEVCCFNCDQNFDATHGEWCRCVGRDNTLVCEHCGGCFCKAPAAYKERFWIDAPPSLFERKMIGSKRSLGARTNPPANDVKRPLILLVEDDENVQLIVRTVVTTMGFGFVVGADGQEGLTLAREYSPELILSDAFMPKLDGREMCRLLKEDPMTARSKAIIMTGLYTDRKYRNEALDYFKVDDYVAKPLAVDDLIKLFKKHLPHEVATAH